MDMPIN